MGVPIPEDELRRDVRIFRALKRKGLTDHEKAALFAMARGHKRTHSAEDYRRFQVLLLKLAVAAHVRTGLRARTKGPAEP